MSGADELAEGMAEALAIAKGEQAAASVTIKGHKYVPATDLTAAEARIQELEAVLQAVADEFDGTISGAERACDRARRTLRGE